MFRGGELPICALPVETIDWLVDVLDQKRPRVVLEFGSGVSTAVLCVILQRLHGVDGFKVLSVEQDANEVRRTQDRLKGLQGRSSCRIVHVPLIPAVVANQPTLVYDIDKMSHEHFAWLGKAEFVLIDGPFSEGPCRYATISKVHAYLAPGAYFVLDDALREKELIAGALWAQEGIVIEGVFTVGEGVMSGIVPRWQSEGKA
jgi:hypothetical protein